jgi:hypothetical protein
MTNTELTLIQRILPNLYRHFKENPKSLIARIYGVYTVEMPHYRPVNLMLLANTLRFRKPEEITKIYDLKGSSINREVKGETKPTSTLKDTNFLQNCKVNNEISL